MNDQRVSPFSKKDWTWIGGLHWLRYYAGRDTDLRIGCIVLHLGPKTQRWCMGSVLFDIPEAQRHRSKKPDGTLTHVWQLVSRDPLHLEPSLLCRALSGPPGPDGKPTECGDHGWIRNGQWVNA